jgi:septum site-determining protein MinD
MKKVIAVASCKGGVGKSTVAANTALFLASAGEKTLLIDCDFSMRCLDLILRLEDNVVYDIYDVISRGIPYKKACVSRGGLDFIAAPFSIKTDESFNAETFAAFIGGIKDDYDYIILDTSASFADSLNIVYGAAESALIVTTAQPASVRGASLTAEHIERLNPKITPADKRLVINFFDFAGVKNKSVPGITELIDKTYVRLIGVVPYSAEIPRGQCGENGENGDTNAAVGANTAFKNIAERIRGSGVPLFSGMRNVTRSNKKLYTEP